MNLLSILGDKNKKVT